MVPRLSDSSHNRRDALHPRHPPTDTPADNPGDTPERGGRKVKVKSSTTRIDGDVAGSTKELTCLAIVCAMRSFKTSPTVIPYTTVFPPQHGHTGGVPTFLGYGRKVKIKSLVSVWKLNFQLRPQSLKFSFRAKTKL